MNINELEKQKNNEDRFHCDPAFIKVVNKSVKDMFSPAEQGMWEKLSNKISKKEKYVFHILIEKGGFSTSMLDNLCKNTLFHRDLINEKDENSLTALHWAARKNIEIRYFEALLAHGGDPNIDDPEGKSVVDYVLKDI